MKFANNDGIDYASSSIYKFIRRNSPYFPYRECQHLDAIKELTRLAKIGLAAERSVMRTKTDTATEINLEKALDKQFDFSKRISDVYRKLREK